MKTYSDDLLVIDKDTVQIKSHPLEQYFAKNNPRPKYIFNSYCASKDYQAIWKLEDDKLYLLKIASPWQETGYHITDKTISLLEKIDIPDSLKQAIRNLKSDTLETFTLLQILGNKYEEYGEELRRSCSVFKYYEKILKLNTLFPNHTSIAPIHATWFTGQLYYYTGEYMYSNCKNGRRIPQYTHILTIDKGVLTKQYISNANDIQCKKTKYLLWEQIEMSIPPRIITYANEYFCSDTILFNRDSSVVLEKEVFALENKHVTHDSIQEFVSEKILSEKKKITELTQEPILFYSNNSIGYHMSYKIGNIFIKYIIVAHNEEIVIVRYKEPVKEEFETYAPLMVSSLLHYSEFNY